MNVFPEHDILCTLTKTSNFVDLFSKRAQSALYPKPLQAPGANLNDTASSYVARNLRAAATYCSM
jgi:hypothetical protein